MLIKYSRPYVHTIRTQMSIHQRSTRRKHGSPKLLGLLMILVAFVESSKIILSLESPSSNIQACAEDKTVYSFKIDCDQDALSLLQPKNLILKLSFPQEYTARQNLTGLAVEWNFMSYQIQVSSTQNPVFQINLPVGVVQQSNILKVYSQRTMLTPYKSGNITFAVSFIHGATALIQTTSSIAVSPALLSINTALEDPYTSTNSCLLMTVHSSCQYFANDTYIALTSSADDLMSLTSVTVDRINHSSYYVQEKALYIRDLHLKSSVNPASFSIEVCKVRTHRNLGQYCGFGSTMGIFGQFGGVLANTQVCIENKYASSIGSMSVVSPTRSVLKKAPLIFKINTQHNILPTDKLFCSLAPEFLLGKWL